MKHENYTIEQDTCIDSNTCSTNITVDTHNIENMDPLIEPLIDSDELKTTIEIINQIFFISESFVLSRRYLSPNV